MATTVEKIVMELTGQSDQFIGELDKVSKKSSNLGKNITKAFKVGAAAIGALVAGTVFALKAFRQQELAENKVRQAIASTGKAAGLSAKEIFNLASELQSVTTFGDETILQGQAILLTFKSIGKDAFPQASKAMLNLATLMQTDLKSGAIQLGKALNDPIGQMSALSRAGVALNDQQKEQIKVFQESGEIQKAQKIILNELTTEFGGQAEAAAKGTGVFKQLKDATGDLVEEIGRNLAPELVLIAQEILKVIPPAKEFSKTALTLVANFVGAGAAITSVIKDISGRISALSTGFGELFLAITDPFGVIFGDNAIKRLKTAAGDFSKAFSGIFGGIGEDAGQAFQDGVAGVFRRSDEFKKLAEETTKIVTEELDVVREKIKTDADLRLEIEKEKGEELKGIIEDNRIARIELEEVNALETQIFLEEREAELFKLEKELRDAKFVSQLEDETLLQQIRIEKEIETQVALNNLRKAELKNQGQFFNSFANLTKTEQLSLTKEYGKFGDTLVAIDKGTGIARSQVINDAEGVILNSLEASGKETVAIAKGFNVAETIIAGLSAGIKTIASTAGLGPTGVVLGIIQAGIIAAKTGFAVQQILATDTSKMQAGSAGSGPAVGDQLLAQLSPAEIVIPEPFSAALRKGDLTLSGPNEQEPDAQEDQVDIRIELSEDASQFLQVRQNEEESLGIRRSVF